MNGWTPPHSISTLLGDQESRTAQAWWGQRLSRIFKGRKTVDFQRYFSLGSDDLGFADWWLGSANGGGKMSCPWEIAVRLSESLR